MIVCADARSIPLPDESVQCVVTSPPYWGLRRYSGNQELIWDALPGCQHIWTGHTAPEPEIRTGLGLADWSARHARGGGHKAAKVSGLRPGRDDPPGPFGKTNHSEKQRWQHKENGRGEEQPESKRVDVMRTWIGQGIFCEKCGAWKGAFGLEPTIEMYVQHSLEVLHEIRRVLRIDGVCFWNIGDSYASDRGHGGTLKETDKQATVRGAIRGSENYVPNRHPQSGLKAKDLCMIPARIAIAAQQPYYTGRIKRPEDRAWLAAAVEGEGCFYIHKRKRGEHAGDGYHRKQDSFAPAFEIANTNLSFIEHAYEIAGRRGSISRQDKDRRQPLYRWTIRCTEAKEFARELYPYLVGKRQQARILYGTPSSGERAIAAWQALKNLHRGQLSDTDFPVPPSPVEPGWYVRSDILWCKPNPMPESVQDRPTDAYEHILMLTKSERYFWDIEAVREAHGRNRWGGSYYSGSLKHQPESSPFTTSLGATSVLRKGGTHFPNAGRNMRNVWSIEEEFGYTPKGTHPRGKSDGGPKARQREAEGNHKNWTESVRYVLPCRNMRNIWMFATQPYSGAHFATFPEELPRRCVKAATSSRGCCLQCGAPWERIVRISGGTTGKGWIDHNADLEQGRQQADGTEIREGYESNYKREEIGWRPTCRCPGQRGKTRPCVVLDPFAGSGTTGRVALELQRFPVLLDLAYAHDYAPLAKKRTSHVQIEAFT